MSILLTGIEFQIVTSAKHEGYILVCPQVFTSFQTFTHHKGGCQSSSTLKLFALISKVVDKDATFFISIQKLTWHFPL